MKQPSWFWIWISAFIFGTVLGLAIGAMLGCTETFLDVSPCEPGVSECIDPVHVERCVDGDLVPFDCTIDCPAGGSCRTYPGSGQSACVCEP